MIAEQHASYKIALPVKLRDHLLKGDVDGHHARGQIIIIIKIMQFFIQIAYITQGAFQ